MNAEEFIKKVQAAWSPVDIHRLMNDDFLLVEATVEGKARCIAAAHAKLEQLINPAEGDRGGRPAEVN
jgi:hypothetical protein